MRVNQNILSRNWIKFQKKDKSRISPSFFYHSDVFKTKCGTVEKLFKFENFFAFCTLLASLFCFILTKGSLSHTHSFSAKIMQQQFHFIFPFSVVRKAKNEKQMHPTLPHPTKHPPHQKSFSFYQQRKGTKCSQFRLKLKIHFCRFWEEKVEIIDFLGSEAAVTRPQCISL